MYTPEMNHPLKPNEIFVFGSNLNGAHLGGAAQVAYSRFGAKWGEGVGLHGQSYAIPTMQGGIETIKPYVDQFVTFAKEHFGPTFYVTRVGCGIAEFRDEEIARCLRRPKNFQMCFYLKPSGIICKIDNTIACIN